MAHMEPEHISNKLGIGKIWATAKHLENVNKIKYKNTLPNYRLKLLSVEAIENRNGIYL